MGDREAGAAFSPASLRVAGCPHLNLGQGEEGQGNRRQSGVRGERRAQDPSMRQHGMRNERQEGGASGGWKTRGQCTSKELSTDAGMDSVADSSTTVAARALLSAQCWTRRQHQADTLSMASTTRPYSATRRPSLARFMARPGRGPSGAPAAPAVASPSPPSLDTAAAASLIAAICTRHTTHPPRGHTHQGTR